MDFKDDSPPVQRSPLLTWKPWQSGKFLETGAGHAQDESRISYAKRTNMCSPTANPSEKPSDPTPQALAPEDLAVDVAPEPQPPEPAPFRFAPLLCEIHRLITGLDRYSCFLFKYSLLQLGRVAATLSLVLAVHSMADELDFSDLSPGQYWVFGGVGVLFVLSMLVPALVLLLIEDLKAELSAYQATGVVAKIFELPHDAMLSTPTGMFVQLIQKVFMHLGTFLPGLYGGVLPMTFEVCAGVLTIGCLYGWICVPQLALFVIYSCVAYKLAAAKAERNREMMTVMLSEWGKIMDTAGSYERAHFFDNVPLEVANAREAFDKVAIRMKHVVGGEHSEGVMLTGLSMVVVVLFSFLVLLSDQVLGPEQLSVMMYFSIWGFNLNAYATAVSNLRTSVLEYQAFDDFMTQLSNVEDVPNAVELEATANPTIEFRNVSFQYGEQLILDGVSFIVQGGHTLGLVGASGCGKSTILRLLMRFYKQTGGSIFVNGHDITQVTAASLRKLFSVVTQDAQLFNGSIRDNIAYGKMAGSDDDSITAAARLAELGLGEADSDLALDKICGEKGAKLSGGQQQRVALARAILKNGSIYLLDEPTTGLDSVVAQQLQRTLDALSTHATTIMITHHLTDLKQVDQIIYLKQGKIVESGSFAELVAADGEFAQQINARSNT